MNTQAKPGAVLKGLRLANGWTLTDVSRRTGLPVSTLSKIENDKMSLSYDKLARISRGLDIDIGLLFSSKAAPEPISLATGRRSITRAGEGRAIEEMIEALSIRVANVGLPVASLSGGNQQKVVIGKWLMTAPRIILLEIGDAKETELQRRRLKTPNDSTASSK